MCIDRVFARRFASVSSFRRALLAAGVCLATMLGAVSAHAATYTVTSTSDASGSATTSGTLRYAITQAELPANAGSLINFSVTGTIALGSALPAITQATTITGPGANVLTISGAGLYQILTVTGGAVLISGLTFSDGSASSGRGGAINNGGALIISDCAFTGNSASIGGAIGNMTGLLTVDGSTFLKNSSTGNGGAIYSNATLNVYNDTFVANSTAATFDGGAILGANGTTTITNNTFSGNSSSTGGAVALPGGTASINNNIFTGNSATTYGAVYVNGATLSSEGNNIFFLSASEAASFTLAGTDKAGVDPMLLPLGNYGGTTPTMLPLPGSPAIGAGTSTGAPGNDQRGFPITSTVDAGAVQTNYSKPTSIPTPANGPADLDLSGLTSPVSITGVEVKSGAVNYIGPGADKLTITGNKNNSDFTVDSGAQAVFYGMTISDGGGNAGGGVANLGTATLIDSVVTGNSTGSSSAAAGSGGGIDNAAGVLTIIGSTISGNTVLYGGVGGGILNNGGSLTMINSTVSGNNAPAGGGGGITSNGTTTLTNVTISGNSATAGNGGGIYYNGSLTLKNSIVEENTATTNPDIDSMGGTLTDGGGNVMNQTTSATTVNLAPLGNYSYVGAIGASTPQQQQTETMLPIPGTTGLSAICAGLSADAVDQYGLPLATDQRGAAFGQSSYCTTGTQVDAGAVQTDYTGVAFTNAGTGYAGIVNKAVNYPAAPIVQVTENGQIVGGVPVTLTYNNGSNPSVSLTGTSETTVANVGADFSNLASVLSSGTLTSTATGTLSTTLQLTATKTLNSNTPDINIYPAVTLGAASLNATVGTSYSFDFASPEVASGGTNTGFTYAATGLPTGMSLSSGTLAGSLGAAGSYPFSVTATDSDGNQSAATNYTLTVGQATTAITMSTSGSTTILPNTAVTFTATLSPATTNTTSADFTKTVTFYSNGAAISTCSGGNPVAVTVTGGSATASCELTNGLAAGSYNITASYPGDTNYSSDTSALPVKMTVSLNSTSTSVASSLSPSYVGQSVKFTATVTNTASGASTAPTGSVSFTSDGAAISGCGPQTLPTVPSGTTTATVSCTTTALPVSTSTGHTIEAVYSGASTFSGSNGTLTGNQVVNLNTTTTAVGTSSATSVVGQPVKFTATVTDTTGTTAPATGTVEFFSAAGTAISGCTAQPLTAGSGKSSTATCTTSALAESGSPYSITATYNGDTTTYAGSSTTVAASQTVGFNTTTTTVASSALSSATVNQAVTFTATVTNSSYTTAPTVGTVNFTSGGATIFGCGTVALTAGSGNSSTATCTTSALALNTTGYAVTAVYTGDATTYKGSTAPGITQIVSLNPTSTSVASSLSSSTTNQAVTFTATVTNTSNTGAPTGDVNFTNGATALCSGVALTAGAGQSSTATCTTSALAASSTAYSIAAAYAGTTSTYQSSTSTAITQTVSKATSSVAVASVDNTTSGLGANTSNANDSVTFTATISPYSGSTALTPPYSSSVVVPGGSVTFTANGATLCAGVAVNNYQATCMVSTLSAGSQSVVATYTGDGNYNGSTNNLTQTVNGIASGITLQSSAPTSTVNQSVTFTANVTPIGKSLGLSGSVSFTDNGSAMSCTPSFDKGSGLATCTVANLPLGANNIMATYAGDTNYTTSSKSIPQTVNQGATSTVVVASPSPAMVNQSVLLTATVTAPAGATQLSGKVSFTDNGTAISGCSLVAVNPNTGQATCATSALPLNANTIAANYTNDANFAGSTGSTSVTVNPATTNIAVVSSAGSNTSVVNQTVAFTATVSGASGAATFSGKMSFASDGNAIAGCTSLPVGVATGVAVCSTTALTAGTHAITASYAGDPNFASNSSGLTEKVTTASSAMTLVSSPNPSMVANPNNVDDVVSLTATISPSNGGVPLSGTVAFTDNGVGISGCTAVAVNAATGIATCPSSFTSYGTHSIVAVYGNDSSYTSSRGTTTQQVQDYQLVASPTAAVGVSQGFNNTNDPFTPQNIMVAATPFGGFTGNLALTCTVAAVTAPQGAVLPTCSLGSATLAIRPGLAGRPVTLTVSAGSGSSLASPGTYNVIVTGVDAATGLTHATAAFTVYVRYVQPAMSLVSGATTGNSTPLNFTLPAGVGITSFQCSTVTGPTLSVSVNPSGLGIGCSFNPSSIAATNTVQTASTTLTISTDVPLSQAMLNHNSKIGGGNTAVEVAGMVGVPLFMLLGFLPGARRTRKMFFRCLGLVFVAVLLFGGVSGCGGGSFTAPKSVSGTTPPGTYNVLVQGTGTDGHMYDAVVTINVTR